MAYRLCLFALASIPWVMVESLYKSEHQPFIKKLTSYFWQRLRGQSQTKKLDELEDWRDEGLINWSLLNRVAADAVQLHQLIREFFRAKLEQWPDAATLKQRYCQGMVQVAQSIPDTPTRDQILAVTPAIPHLAEAATTWQRWLEDDSLGWPFTGIGRFYEGQGAYGQAEPWYQDCLAVTRDRLGETHLVVTTSLNDLALLYESQGRYSEAEPLLQEALAL